MAVEEKQGRGRPKSNDPDLSRCTYRFCSKVLGISRPTFKTRVRQGIYPAGDGHKKWDLAKVFHAHLQWITSSKEEKSLEYSKREIYQERLKALRAENELALGELIRKDAANDVFMEAMSIIATRLEALPGRLATELAGISDAGVIRQRLRNEVTVLRGEASNRLKTFFDSSGGSRDIGATAYPRSKRVGRPKSNSSTRVR